MARYLIVDDNRAFAENLAEILEDAGHAALVVETPAAALSALQTQPPFDAVLSDMRMPQMTGAALLHEVRKIDPHLPAVVITAYSGDEDLRLARNEGLVGVLGKPLDPKAMLETLRRARRGGLVALLEDDLALADNLTEALRLEGFATVTACNVLETDRLAHLRPFAAIADLRVPGGRDGEAMKRFAEKFPQVPIFVVTALEEVTPPAKYERIFRKPFSTPELLRAVEAKHAQGAR